MTHYGQFLEINNTGELDEAIGFDSIFILDGRNSLKTMEKNIILQFHRINKFHNYCGWRIMKGERFDNPIILMEWLYPRTKLNDAEI